MKIITFSLIVISAILTSCQDAEEKQKTQVRITSLGYEVEQLEVTVKTLKKQQIEFAAMLQANNAQISEYKNQREYLNQRENKSIQNVIVPSLTNSPQTMGGLFSDLRTKFTDAMNELKKHNAEQSPSLPKSNLPSKRVALQQWASRNLLLASQEDQLRAALAIKLARQRNGQRFSADEFQFFDDQSKSAIILYTPELLPPELLAP